MKFKDWLLAEMPMSNYRYRFDKIIPTSVGIPHFNQKDRAAIENITVQKKLEEVLNRTGYNFNILFIEVQGLGYQSYPKTQYRKIVRFYCNKNNIPLEGHITFAKKQSTGDVMSPWMILHTMGHALLENTNEFIAMNNTLTEFARDIRYYDKTSLIPNEKVESLSRLFMFASARNKVYELETGRPHKKSIADFDELIYDLVAEYLWHGGRIRVNQQTAIKLQIDHKINNFIQSIQNIISGALHKNVGNIIVDI